MNSKENRQDLESRLEALDVYIASLEARPQVALEMLREATDPESIRFRLSLLLKTARLDEAVELVNSTDLDGRWLDLAAVAFLRAGDLEKAEEMVALARKDNDESVGRRAAVAFAMAVLDRRDESRPLNSADRKELQRASVVVSPDVEKIKRRGETITELESQIVQCAFAILQFLEQGDDLRELVPLLERRSPVPLPLAQAALTGWIPASAKLSARLKKEHPGSIPAQILALALDGELLGKTRETIDAALELREAATTPQHRKDLGRLLLNLIDTGSAGEYGPEVEEATRQLLREDEEVKAPLEATRLLQEGKPGEALRILEENKRENDPHWLQAYANYLFQTGESTTAVRMLRRAAELMPHPELFRMAASVAYEARLLSDAADCLERYLQRRPDDVSARRGLAAVYWDSQKYEEAARQFSTLVHKDDDVEAHRLNEAACYSRLGDIGRTLEILDKLVRECDPTVRAVVQRAKLLTLVGRPRDAFEFLSAFRDRYWDDPSYLLSLMNTGYAAGEEAAAHAAMLRLLELQQRGAIEEPFLQEKSLEDLKELLRGRRELRELLYDELLRCRTPWLLVDDLLGESPYLSWHLRTQSVRWVSEDRASRASFVIPSTNGFTRGDAPGAKATLIEIKAPPPNRPLVVDLSALLTVHRLNLLKEMLRYAGMIYIPATYLSDTLEERSRLLDHQPSRSQAIRDVKRLLDRGRLILDEPQEGSTCIRVSEYAEAEADWGEPLRLMDIIDSLYDAGRLDEGAYAQVRAAQLKPKRIAAEEEPLALGTHLSIDLETLRRLSSEELLEMVVTCFPVHLTDEEREEIIAENETADLRESVLRSHQDLWERMRKLKNVVVAPDWPVNEHCDEENAVAVDRHLAAFRLAKDKGFPLMADDRALQAMMLNDPQAQPGAAFGTDALLIALLREGRAKVSDAADAFNNLIRWRYRFLVVPPELLCEYAARYARHPPGEDLRQMAAYLQSCMADPGLLSGVEEGTDPPLSMAQRFFLSWAANVAEFLVDIWEDSRFGDDGRTQLVTWSCRQFLPCPPNNMGSAGARLSELLPSYVLGRALVRSATYSDEAKMNRALRTLAGALGLSDSEYRRAVARIIYGRSLDI